MSSSRKQTTKPLPKNILVTNANWGIGLGIVRQLCEMEEPEHIFALEKNPREGKELQQIPDKRLHVITCDIKSDRSISNAFKEVSTVLGSNGLNLLINNAEDPPEHETEHKEKERDRELFNQTLESNAVGLVVLTEKFLPLLLRNADPKNLDIDHAAIINIESDMEHHGHGPGHAHKEKEKCCDNRDIAFRMAKASLIEFSNAFSRELHDKGVLVVCLHPGHDKHEKRHQPFEQAHRLMDSMCRLNKGQNGGYFAYDTQTPAF